MRYIYLFLSLFILSCSGGQIINQKPIKETNEAELKGQTSLIPFEIFKNDELGIRKYVLKNGLTVFTTVNKEEPRIQTVITTKAGSVHDPSDATGLAHYLEHMLFKGTNRIGTVNYEKEQVDLERIKTYFEIYRQTTDSTKRAEIYFKIDSISSHAAQYVCPSEFDQLQTVIGAQGVNAYTYRENTTYHCDIPSNQLNNWIKLESERFRFPVLRLFHTELETVYEEKNRTLDNSNRQAFELLMSKLFKNHNYGKRTGIGEIEHLKSPSMLEIEKFYNTYYRPINMCIILSGDFDPDKAVQEINKSYFGKWEPKEIPPYAYEPEQKINAPIKENYFTQDPEALFIAFRLPHYTSSKTTYAKMLDYVLANSSAGLIDLNINKKQKATYAVSYEYLHKDYGMLILFGMPTQGQTLEELEKLLLAQLDSVKNGNFPDWLIEANMLNAKKKHLQELLGNKTRAFDINDAFVLNQSIQGRLNELEELSKVDKAGLMTYVKENFDSNYVVVYKRHKDNFKNNLKVQKPPITPLQLNENNHSSFYNEFVKNKVESLQPMFVKYSEYIDSVNYENGNTLVYQQNKDNELFWLTFEFPVGTFFNNKLGLAASLAELCPTSKLSSAQIEQEFYKLGSSYSIGTSDKTTSISISGLNEKFDETLNLLVDIVFDLKLDEQQLEALKAKVVKSKNDALNDKSTLFGSGLKKYLIYKENSPLKSELSISEIEKLKGSELLKLFNELLLYNHKSSYYGPLSMDTVQQKLSRIYFGDKKYSKAPLNKEFERVKMGAENEIFIVDYEMQQAEILFLSNDTNFDKSRHLKFELFNEYYGSGMASVVFQELREKKALAYSSYAGYSYAYDTINPQYVIGYIGAQADKTIDAIGEMLKLLNKMPLDSIKFEQAKQNFKQGIETNRIARNGISASYFKDTKLGYSSDSREFLYQSLNDVDLSDIEAFFNKHIKGSTYNIGIIGNVKELPIEELKKFGKVTILKKEELFNL